MKKAKMKKGQVVKQKRKKRVKIEVRIRMQNLSFRAHNPDKVVHEHREFQGDYFPPEIIRIKDPNIRGERMKQYAALHRALKLQKKYKHSCQSEMSILKEARKLGLYPMLSSEQKREFKRWESARLFDKIGEAAKKSERALRRKKVVKHKPYTFFLLKQAKEYGFKSAVRIGKKIRKEARVRFLKLRHERPEHLRPLTQYRLY